MSKTNLLGPSQDSDLSRRGMSFSARAEEKRTWEAAQGLSRLKTFALLSALSNPEGQNPPSFLAGISSQLAAGKNFKASVSALSEADRSALRNKIDDDLLAKLSSLAEEPQSGMFFAGLLDLGRDFKSNHDWAKASIVLGMLAQGQSSGDIPAEIRDAANREWQAMQGQGSTGMRLEFLFSRAAEDAADVKNIAPMFGASIVGQVASSAFMSRMVASPGGSILSRGLGLRFASAAAGYLLEVPAFATFNRLLSPQASGNFTEDLERSALTIGALKTFGFLGNKAFLQVHGFNEIGLPTRLNAFTRFSQAAVPQVSMLMGLMASHKLEERLSLRPKVDNDTSFTDSVVSLITLGAGNHLGGSVLGPRFAQFQRELGIRGEIFGKMGMAEIIQHSDGPPSAPSLIDRLFPAQRKFAFASSFLPEGLMAMTAAVDPNQIQTGGKEVVAAPEIPRINHRLEVYQRYAEVSLMGNILKNIRARLSKGQGPVAVLDIGSGKGLAVQEIKEYLRDMVRIETNDLDPLQSDLIDQHHQGDFLEVDFKKQYDLAFSTFGPHAYHQGKLFDLLQKTASLLKPNGEFLATFKSDSLAREWLNPWSRFPKIQEFLGRGWILRFESMADGAMLYMRRIGEAAAPNIQELLVATSPRPAQSLAREIVQKLLKANIMVDGLKLPLEYPFVESIAENFAKLQSPAWTNWPEILAEQLFRRYLKDFEAAKRKQPKPRDIEDWVMGNEPSPLRNQEILIDELIRIHSEELEAQQAKKAEALVSPEAKHDLSRQLQERIRALRSRVEKIPASNSQRQALLERTQLLENHPAGKTETDIQNTVDQIRSDINRAWHETLSHRMKAVLPALKGLAEEIPNSESRARLAEFVLDSSQPEPVTAPVQERIKRFWEVFHSVLEDYSKDYWAKNHPEPYPARLTNSLIYITHNLALADLFSEEFSPETMKDFVQTFTQFFHDFPPPPGFLILETASSELPFNKHFLLGSQPNANAYLESISRNLKGHRALFGKDAGGIFHREGLLVSPLKNPAGEPTGYYLAMGKGQHEFENGLRLTLYPQNPRMSSEANYLAKIGLHFAEDGSMRIVNIQGANKSLWALGGDRLTPLPGLLGDAHPLDMLVATAILMGRNAGFSRIEGIRDTAQNARLDRNQKSKGKGHYDLFFRRFGFRPPHSNEDYWSLDLQDMEIHPKSNGSPSEILSPQDYFAKILVRKSRDASGKNIRPAKWNQMEANSEDPAVQAFWQIMAPALSDLQWMRGPAYNEEDPFRPTVARPFALGDLQAKASPAEKAFFREALGLKNESFLSEAATKQYRSILERASEGKISGKRAQVELLKVMQREWAAPFEKNGARVIEYSVDDFLDEDLEFPAWFSQLKGTALARNSKVTEIILEKQALLRYLDSHPDSTWNLSTALAYFRGVQEEMNFPDDALSQSHQGQRFRIRTFNPEFLFQVPRLMHGDKAMESQPVANLVPESGMKQMMRGNIRPIIFSPLRQEIHELEEVDPYLGSIHDFFHLYRMSNYIPETRAELPMIHDIFLQLRHFQNEEEIVDTVLNKVLDGDQIKHNDHRGLFRAIALSEPSKSFKLALEEKLEVALEMSPRKQEVMKAYREEMWKEDVDPDPDSGNSGSSLAAGAALGLGIFLTPKLALASNPARALMDPHNHGLLALGVISFGGLVYAGYRIWKSHSQESNRKPMFVAPWIEKNLRVPLDAQERMLLRPYFKNRSVPRTLTGKDWKEIATSFMNTIFQANGDKAIIDRPEYYELYQKLTREIMAEQMREPTTQPLSPQETEDSWQFGWSRARTSNDDRSYDDDPDTISSVRTIPKEFRKKE